MFKSFSATPLRPALSLAVMVVLGTMLSGCATTAEQQRADLNADIDTCTSFGARYGSPEHTQCMLVQQQRRDGESLAALERARLATEISRNNQAMIDRRRQAND